MPSRAIEGGEGEEEEKSTEELEGGDGGGGGGVEGSVDGCCCGGGVRSFVASFCLVASTSDGFSLIYSIFSL